jgi:hypothetical protein
VKVSYEGPPMEVSCEGPLTKSRGWHSLGFEKRVGRERERAHFPHHALCIIYRQQHFTISPLVGMEFIRHYTKPYWASLSRSWPIHHMGFLNGSPSATSLWLVLHYLVDVHTRRGAIQLKPWL